MVEKFKKILEEIEKGKGPVSLFVVAKMDDITDKWSVILSAPWANEDEKKSFKFVFDLLKVYLSEEEDNSIARIGIFNKEEHLIELLLQYKKGSTIQNEKVNGNIIHLAYVLESNQDI